MNETKCPACGGQQHYKLGDNRLQCAQCRKKYTVGIHRSKLSPQALHAIAQSFWRMIPASAAAAKQGINSKTLQKYYDLLRRTIAADNERSAVERFGATDIDPALFHDSMAGKRLGMDVQPLFCLAEGSGKVALLPSRDGSGGEFADVGVPQILGWVYAKDRKALTALDLDHIHFLPAVATGGGDSTFWIYVKKGLVRYHGGFRKNFHLFVREMEFRFNNRHEDAVLAVLTEILLSQKN